MDDKELICEVREMYRRITQTLIDKGLTISAMESCTGGLIASLITDTEGSSAVMKGSFVTYSNEAKIKQGVPPEVIEKYGVYSEETAAAMAEACKRAYAADIGIGITGTMANTDPNNGDSIPGEVFFAIAADTVRTYTVKTQPRSERAAGKFAAAGEVAVRLTDMIEKR